MENQLKNTQEKLSYAAYLVEQNRFYQYVSNDIRDVLFQLMEHWLVAHKISSSPRNLLKLRTDFMSQAPANLTSSISSYFAQADILEIELFGDSDIPSQGNWDYDRWRSEARDCLGQCQKILDKIKAANK